MTTNEIAAVRRAAKRFAAAQATYRQAIRDAHAAGASTRKIAAAAGTNHVHVQRLLKEER